MKILLILSFLSLPAFGNAKYNGTCIACHGEGGRSTNSIYPNLAGQKKSYLKKQLEDFKSGKRRDPIMSNFVRQLTPKDIEEIATYLSKQECK